MIAEIKYLLSIESKGIKLVMGPIEGLKINKLLVDYTGMHSSYFPYYASKNDIRKVDNNSLLFNLDELYL